MEDYCFYICEKLECFEAPLLEKVGNRVFTKCKLKKFYAHTLSNVIHPLWENCEQLKNVVAPLLQDFKCKCKVCPMCTGWLEKANLIYQN